MSKGIDISTFQGNVDLKKAAKEIEFVVIRAGYGTKGTLDEKFKTNYEKAKKAGLKIGLYWYSYALTVEGVRKEAQTIKKIINKYPCDLPFAWDIEENSFFNLGAVKCRELIMIFMDELKGYNVSIYTSKSRAEQLKLYESDYKIWIAQWNNKCTYKGHYYMWQYSDKGEVAGIPGRVDLDELYYEPEKPVDIDDLARRVIAGEFGNGDKRKKLLGKYYFAVQKRVNEMLKVPDTVQPKKGLPIKFNNYPLFKSAYASTKSRNISGTYYLYDGVKINGRYRITTFPEFAGKKPMSKYVTGYIQIK